jgi:hypothetical protein
MTTKKRLTILKQRLSSCYYDLNVIIHGCDRGHLSTLNDRMKIREMKRETLIRIDEIKSEINEVTNQLLIEQRKLNVV